MNNSDVMRWMDAQLYLPRYGNIIIMGTAHIPLKSKYKCMMTDPNDDYASVISISYYLLMEANDGFGPGKISLKNALCDKILTCCCEDKCREEDESYYHCPCLKKDNIRNNINKIHKFIESYGYYSITDDIVKWAYIDK